MAIRICQWSRFQHFKDRRPIWLKLYRDLLHKREWRRLSGDAAKLLVDLWMIAAEQADSGVISACIEDVAYDLREPVEKLATLLQELVEQGFIECDSDAISSGYQEAIPRALAREEKSREETEEETTAPARENFSTAVDVEVLEDDGSSLIHPGQRMSGSQVLHAWASRFAPGLAGPDRRRQAQFARKIADHHTAEEVAAAFVGMTQLFPYSKGEPWDLRDLDNKFAKATAAARDHPELRSAKRDAELMDLLGGAA